MKCVFFILMLLIVPFTVCADNDGTFTKHYKESLFQVTEQREFSVEIVVQKEELKVGYNSAKLIIHDRNDHDVEGAEITIVPWMPDMGHGVKAKTVITDKGHGLYEAENIEFSMTGRWEWKITIKKGTVEDKVLFEFPDIQSGKKFY